MKTTWHQNPPFNGNCYTDDGKQAVAGCTAIAAAQMLAKNRKPGHPNQIDGSITSTWDELIAYNPNTVNNSVKSDYQKRIEGDLAKLIHKVGREIDTDYGESESIASGGDVRKYFKKLDYDVGGAMIDYDKEKVEEMIEDLLPVFVRGERDGGSGHFWVIDGYARMATTYNSVTYGDYVYSMGEWVWKEWTDYNYHDSHLLFHCNFGWGGRANGYYWPDIFDTSNPVVRDTNATGSANYSYEMDMFRYSR
jgi:hypothetical protein